jgi:hypothetical protein
MNILDRDILKYTLLIVIGYMICKLFLNSHEGFTCNDYISSRIGDGVCSNLSQSNPSDACCDIVMNLDECNNNEILENDQLINTQNICRSRYLIRPGGPSNKTYKYLRVDNVPDNTCLGDRGPEMIKDIQENCANPSTSDTCNRCMTNINTYFDKCHDYDNGYAYSKRMYLNTVRDYCRRNQGH